MSNHAVEGRVSDFLKQEGYSITDDLGADVFFNFEGMSYFISTFENDDTYFRVTFPSFWSIENTDDRFRALFAMHSATRATKAAKVYLVEDNVWASVEAFAPDVDSFLAVLLRALRSLQMASRHFGEEMIRLAPAK